MSKLSDDVERKFVDSIDLDEWEIETDTGFHPVSAIHKTIPYDVWEVETEDGSYLACADDHILFRQDYTEVFAKDLVPGDLLITRTGSSRVIKVEKTGDVENMFDVTVESPDHRFWTGGFLSHNTQVVASMIIHFMLFNDYKSVAILANKEATSIEILDRVQFSYQLMPSWIQQGVVEWSKKSCSLENGSKAFAAATSASSVRGKSVDYLYIDEAAHIEGWDKFFTSTYPVVSSRPESKVILTSTPLGLNHFHKLWVESEQGDNPYVRVLVTWQEIPDRDEEWRRKTLQTMGNNLDQFAQEYEMQFLGSSGTLISGAKLKELVHRVPIASSMDGFLTYKEPESGHKYVICADVSEGKGMDYSAYSVIDITQMPYEQVATFKSNMIGAPDYAYQMHGVAKKYNDADVLIEVNIAMGPEVANILHHDLEYENVLSTANAGAHGKRISAGFGQNVDKGLRTTAKSKATGCSLLKLLIESNQLIINDRATIEELSTFSRDTRKSFSAEPGKHDDTVMSLVIFAWLSGQSYFTDLTDIHTLNKLREKTDEDYLNEVSPFGFIRNGLPQESVDLELAPGETIVGW